MTFSRRLACLTALAAVAVVVGPASSAGAATRTVNNSPGCNDATGSPSYCTIGAAVGASSSGDTISVATGVGPYAGSDIPHGLSIRGPNYGISPNGGPRVAEAVVTGSPAFRISTTEPVTIDGFTFTGGTGAPIDSYTSGNKPTIAHNIFRNEDDGFFFFESGSFTFDDNYLHDLADCGGCEGLFLAGNWNGTTGTVASITDNVWENLTGPATNLSNVSGAATGNSFSYVSYYDLFLANGTNMDISDNTFDHTINPGLGSRTWGAGVRFFTPGPGFGARITDNEFTDNYVGIGVRQGTSEPTVDITGLDVYAHDNNFVGNTAAGIRHDGVGTFNAECNWWNSAGGPTAPGADMAEGPVDYTPWLTSPAPEGFCNGPIPVQMERKEAVRDSLTAKRNTVGISKKDQNEIDEAIKSINKSLESGNWADGNHLDPKKGNKVFDEEKNAVEHLLKVKGPTPNVSSEITELVDIDHDLAQTAIDEIPATANNPKNQSKVDKERAEANKEQAKGDTDAGNGKAKEGIDHYKHAWEHAQKATEEANKA
jgi:hypothetical protein